ncbi:MAG TPA: helix-turn-helix transcriptional regulator [Chitinophagaceae bacterium]|nr:helix-turn-helix transcriptional regulator [Chitinophagaceae bacterium]
MDTNNSQQLFFHHIKTLLPPHLAMVDEVAEVLNISNDSAYRRIRGEKPIALEEIKKLCVHFKISLDQFLHLNSNSVLFTGKLADRTNFSFDLYLENLLSQMQMIASFQEKELYYWAKDAPVIYYYQFPELAAFKFFFWMKTVLEYPEYNKAKFNFTDFDVKLRDMGEKLLDTYNNIPSHEIWNVDNINTYIQQIEYYKDTDVFNSKNDIIILYECLEKMVDHIEEQAEAGYKFNSNAKGSKKAPIKIYVNEFIIGDNTVMAVLDKKPIVFLNHSFLNVSATQDPVFCNYMFEYFQKLIRKSTLISSINEKQRRIFFNPMREKLARSKKAVL